MQTGQTSEPNHSTFRQNENTSYHCLSGGDVLLRSRADLLIPLSIADVTGRRERSCDRGAVATSATNFGDDGGGFRHGDLVTIQFSAASIDLSLKAAYGLIIRERRRYFRCPVEAPVVIRRTSMPTVHGHTVNVSEGGMSITTVASLGRRSRAIAICSGG